MPSTFTGNTGIEKIADGEQTSLWGQTTNLNFDIIDRALNGSVDVVLSGTTHTLTTSDGVLSDGQFAVLVFTGSPSGTNTVTIAPNTAQKLYFVRNATAQTVVLSQGSGANVSIPAGLSKIVYSNGGGAGAAVFDITNTLSGTFTGNVTGNADTATALQTARTINGTSFNGTSNITTANWGTARTLTIGGTGKSVNGSGNVSWSLGEIGVNNSTLTLATSGIATGSQTWTSNQGSNATFTVNVPATNLGQSRNATSYTVTSSTGSNTTLDAATTSNAGVMVAADKTKLNGIQAGAQVNVATNLTYSTAATTGTVNSSTGTNATIPAATTSLAGLMTNADKTKLDGIQAGAQVNVGTNLGQGGSGNSRTITSSTGSNVTVSTATTSNAGFMSTGDKSKLDGIAAGAQVNVGTNLGQGGSGNSRTITSSTGSNVTVSTATTSNAGFMSTGDKSKLDGIAAGAQVNVGTNLSWTAGTTAGPRVNSSTGSNAVMPTASATASGAVTTGNQTWAGTKTFSAAVVLSTAGTAANHAVRADRTITAGTGLTGGGNLRANRTFAVDSTVIRTTGNQTIAGTKTFRNSGGSRFERASGQDAVRVRGRSGGTGSFAVTITPTTLSANRTVTLANGNTTLVSGTMVNTSRTISTGTGLTGGGNLSANRTINAVTLTQAQVQSPTSTVFGMVSGQRLTQAFNVREQQVGVGQTWQDVTSSRAVNTIYQNTTGKPIAVSAFISISAIRIFQVSPNASTWIFGVYGNSTIGLTPSIIIPSGWYYRVNGSGNLQNWSELR